MNKDSNKKQLTGMVVSSSMDKTVGITGISGAVGSFLKPYLKSNGVRVVSLDEKTRRLDRPNFMPEDAPMDWIIHIGAHTSIEESWSDPFKFYTGNSLATLAALEIAHVNKAKFIYISSYVYGVPNIPQLMKHILWMPQILMLRVSLSLSTFVMKLLNCVSSL